VAVSDTEIKSKKRVGGPRKYAPDAKRSTLTFRVHEAMRERLEKVCAQSGRSLSEEIEYRVERSFREVDVHNLLDFYFGSKETIALLREIAPYITYQMAKSGKSWRNDKATRDALREHLSGLFDALDDEEGYAARTAAWEAMNEYNANAWKDPPPLQDQYRHLVGRSLAEKKDSNSDASE
jgi:hypothetical protein